MVDCWIDPKAWSSLQKFFQTGKIIFLRHENIFWGSEKTLEKQEKLNFVTKTWWTKKLCQKFLQEIFSARHTLFVTLLHTNIKTKTFWVFQIFMERHLKEEFHVLVKELKLLDLKFFFKQFHTTSEKLDNLLAMVAPRIMWSLLHREAIGPMERLCYFTLPCFFWFKRYNK